MKIFITGGTGFIGRQLVRRLKQSGHAMYCLSRRTSDTRELKELGAQIITGDVTDWDSLRHGMRSCDWVMHLAGINSFWEADPDIYRRINTEGTRNVMQCALEAGISKVVHISSVLIFGQPDEMPLREHSPVGPVRLSAYAQSKYEGDLIAWRLYREKALPLVVIYPCAVLGSGDTKYSGEIVQRLMERRLPATVFNGSAMSFVHVKDVAEIILRAAEHEDNLGESYIAGNTTLTLGNFYRLVSEISGIPSPRLRLPEALTLPLARMLTRIADRIKWPPPFGLSIDAMRTLRAGVHADGGKAQRDLGISYTPIRKAVVDDCGWHQLYSADRIRARQTHMASTTQDWSWVGEDRRIQDRQEVELTCDLDGIVHGETARVQAQAINLSSGGMYVQSANPLDEGTETRITVIQFGQTFWVKGKILRSTENGMAIGFEQSIPREIKRMLNSRGK